MNFVNFFFFFHFTIIININLLGGFNDPVLSIVHCALQNSAAIFLMLNTLGGLIAFCNSFVSAMSVVKRLFMYLFFY